MQDENKNKILYRPKIGPEKDYRSEGVIPKTKKHEPKSYDEPRTDVPRNIYHDFEEINELLEDIPIPFQNVIDSIKKLQIRLMVEFPTGDPPDIEETGELVESDEKVTMPTLIPKDDNGAPKFNPGLFPSPNGIMLEVEAPKTIVQLIQDGYQKDTINIENHYLERLQLMLRRYYQQMFAIIAECGVEKVEDLGQEFDGVECNVTNPNLKHLSDQISRSQVMREQKNRLMNKIFNVDNTIRHLEQWQAAEKQRERYYQEQYGDSGTYLDSHSNAILRSCRSSYDAAYNQALYNVFKYFDGSINMMSDILGMSVTEAQAKGKLINEGYDVFTTRAMKRQAEADAAKANMQAELAAKMEELKKQKYPTSMNGGELKNGNLSISDSNTLDWSNGTKNTDSKKPNDDGNKKGGSGKNGTGTTDTTKGTGTADTTGTTTKPVTADTSAAAVEAAKNPNTPPADNNGQKQPEKSSAPGNLQSREDFLKKAIGGKLGMSF